MQHSASPSMRNKHFQLFFLFFFLTFSYALCILYSREEKMVRIRRVCRGRPDLQVSFTGQCGRKVQKLEESLWSTKVHWFFKQCLQDIYFMKTRYFSSNLSKVRRACGHVDVGTRPHQVLTSTLTLSQPGGTDYAHPILMSTPSFESHRRAWTFM